MVRLYLSQLVSFFKNLVSFRSIIHIPHGIAVFWFASAAGEAVALAWVIGFLAYELNQDRHYDCKAYRDILGLLFGMAIGLCVTTLGNFAGWVTR